jgi:uncharacterized glyoxalase superfamily protein PhnB
LDRRGSYSPFAGLPLQDQDERRIPLGQAREFAELWQADCNAPLLGSVEFGPKDDVMPEKSNGPLHDRALAFYTEKLGFRLVTDQPFSDEQRWIDLGISGADTRVVLFRFGEELKPGGKRNLTFWSDDVEATARELKSKGVKFVREPKREDWGTAAAFKDVG